MRLEGSCHCARVRFAVDSDSPCPYQACYCSICRKTAGGGGFAVNLGARADTLEVQGEEHIQVFHAQVPDPDRPGERCPSAAARHFCRHCGSALWLFDPRWPGLLHPFASAVDTPLPAPPERLAIMLDHAADWSRAAARAPERGFPEYPDESLAAWHRRHGLNR